MTSRALPLRLFTARGQRWALTTAHLLSRAFDDQVVVYNAESGDTHLLGPLHMALLDILRLGPDTTAGLIDKFESHLGPADDQWRGPGLGLLLEGLYKLALIEPTEE